MNNYKPNLFQWATSELSQDAFICWLLSWSNYEGNEEKALQETAFYFISKLTGNKISDYRKVEVVKQYKNIDILVKIGNEYVVLIEDKTDSCDRVGQLKKYLEVLSLEFRNEKIIPVYLKTGDQGDFIAVKKAGYNLFLRNDLIDVLEYGIKRGVSNNILIDFLNHLVTIEQSVQSYKLIPVNQWHSNSWKGFYTELAKQLNDGIWSYVPQKNGGFLGFWWSWQNKEYDDIEFECYLQLEYNKFCFKVYPYKKEEAEEVRQYYRNLLFQKAKENNINIYQNGRIGNTMTVAALTESYIKTDDQGFLDLEKTIALIKEMEKLISNI